MDTKDWLVPLLTVGGSFGGAWLAAQFALRRFYKEKIWERKTAAYTAIFEALHYIGQYYQKHFDARARLEGNADDEVAMRAAEESVKAQAELQRRLASETWLIPDECRLRLEKLTEDLNQPTETFAAFVNCGKAAVDSAINDLRKMVQRDLRVGK